MTILHARTSARALGVMATVTAAIPLCLTGCAPAVDLSAQAAELQAAPDSDLLTLPVSRAYDVTEINLIAPMAASALGSALENQISSTGYMVINDGMITAAELTVKFADMPEASFVQTKPTRLISQSDDDIEAISSVGTLSVGNVSQPNTSVELTPTELGEDQAQFDVTFAVPDNLLASTAGLPFDEVSAHLVLVSQ